MQRFLWVFVHLRLRGKLILQFLYEIISMWLCNITSYGFIHSFQSPLKLVPQKNRHHDFRNLENIPGFKCKTKFLSSHNNLCCAGSSYSNHWAYPIHWASAKYLDTKFCIKIKKHTNTAGFNDFLHISNFKIN